MNIIAQELIDAAKELNKKLAQCHFAEPVAYTYNPLEYAWNGNVAYIQRYVTGEVDVLYLGMNPGPFGMAQTGVPFGETHAVTEWLGLHALIGQPAKTHPKRPIDGFGCPRSEVSGRRLWGLMAELYGTAELFFKQSYVANFCPLIWMKESAANITPDKIAKAEMITVNEACQHHLQRTIKALKPKVLVGIGGYAKQQLELAAKALPEMEFTVTSILHPSPASPMANKLWPEKPREQIRDIFTQAELTMPPNMD